MKRRKIIVNKIIIPNDRIISKLARIPETKFNLATLSFEYGTSAKMLERKNYDATETYKAIAHISTESFSPTP